jgi:hypothetical protein
MDAHPMAKIGLTDSGSTVENVTCQQVILLDEPDRLADMLLLQAP